VKNAATADTHASVPTAHVAHWQRRAIRGRQRERERARRWRAGREDTHLERELAVACGAGWVEEDVEGSGQQQHGAACAARVSYASCTRSARCSCGSHTDRRTCARNTPRSCCFTQLGASQEAQVSCRASHNPPLGCGRHSDTRLCGGGGYLPRARCHLELLGNV
jgi:hypothetical protein